MSHSRPIPTNGLEPAPAPVGEPIPRLDGYAKVTGAARYTADLVVPGMCHAAVLRSIHPAARIVSVDATRAKQLPGVVAVVTAEDLPDVDLVYGGFIADHLLIAKGKTRFVGEPVVGVVAEDPFAAEEALELIDVEYEPLPYVDDPLQALTDDAPLVHDQAPPLWGRAGDPAPVRPHPNVCAMTRHAWGDPDPLLANAAVVIEGEYRFPCVFAYPMEPYAAIASFEQGNLTVWSCAAHPTTVRDDLAKCFRLPHSRVQVLIPYVGGAFGGKSLSKIEPLTAALALRAGRPVKLVLSVEESIRTSRGGGALVRLRTGFDRDGRIVARAGTIWLDCGAYAETSPGIAHAAAARLSGAYRVPALRMESYTVYTNRPPSASIRGFGAHEAVWASEQQMDEAAERLGIDPIEIRRRNLLSPGELSWSGSRPFDADLRADLDLLTRELGWDHAPGAGRGLGIGISASDADVPHSVSVGLVRVHADGSLSVHSGSVEIGQGSQTVLAQIAAGEMGIDLAQIHMVQGSTSYAPFERTTGASRTTVFAGRALQRACDDAREQLRSLASSALSVPIDDVLFVRGGVQVHGEMHDWGSIVRAWFGGPAGEIVGRGYVRRVDEFKLSPPFWEIGCIGVEVAVDAETGIVRVERLVTVADIGRAINPLLAEGQDTGAAIMGMGFGLFEELRFRDGVILNGNLFDYRVPRTKDLPWIKPMLAERGEGIGPYGAKGGGEGALNPAAPAIANAVARACGVRIYEGPITPERVWRALRSAKQAEG